MKLEGQRALGRRDVRCRRPPLDTAADSTCFHFMTVPRKHPFVSIKRLENILIEKLFSFRTVLIFNFPPSDQVITQKILRVM